MPRMKPPRLDAIQEAADSSMAMIEYSTAGDAAVYVN
jgi:hypothetical protein